MGWFASVIDAFNSAAGSFENWLGNSGSDAVRLAGAAADLEWACIASGVTCIASGVAVNKSGPGL